MGFCPGVPILEAIVLGLDVFDDSGWKIRLASAMQSSQSVLEVFYTVADL
jgi:hypothetical protein